MIVDLFAGAGGWAEGLRVLGLRDVGLEIDRWACATAAAAGHATIRADVSTYPPEPFRGRVEGLIASPPCQDFSRAGRRAGMNGRTGRLVHEVMRWAADLRPLWIACEQVPDVLPIWQEFAWRLRGMGYSTWTGILCSADYGVPQTRERAFLLAHREKPALPPEPTHCRGGRPAGLFVPELQPWVSMAEALGWPLGLLETENRSEVAGAHVDYLRGTDRPAPSVVSNADRWTLHTNRDQRPNGDRQTVAVDRPALVLTGKSGGQWSFRVNARENATVRTTDEPAPALHVGHGWGEMRWWEEPATTILAGRNRSTSELPNGAGAGSVRVSVQEAAVLQGFRPDYPWQGTKTAQFAQVGNAIPPPWAAAILEALR